MDQGLELKSKVKQLIVRQLKLEIDPKEIGDTAPLFGDDPQGLGLDSIDALELVLGVEKEFGIKVRESELDFLSRLDFSSPEVMREGYLTAATVDRLKEWLPALQTVPDPAKVKPAALFAMISVETLCLMIQRQLPA